MPFTYDKQILFLTALFDAGRCAAAAAAAAAAATAPPAQPIPFPGASSRRTRRKLPNESKFGYIPDLLGMPRDVLPLSDLQGDTPSAVQCVAHAVL